MSATCQSVNERLKGASARRFKRGQFDRKGMVHSDSGFLRKPSTVVGPWYVVWKADHPEAVREYRVGESRQKEDRKQITRARRIVAAKLKREQTASQ